MSMNLAEYQHEMEATSNLLIGSTMENEEFLDHQILSIIPKESSLGSIEEDCFKWVSNRVAGRPIDKDIYPYIAAQIRIYSKQHRLTSHAENWLIYGPTFERILSQMVKLPVLNTDADAVKRYNEAIKGPNSTPRTYFKGRLTFRNTVSWGFIIVAVSYVTIKVVRRLINSNVTQQPPSMDSLRNTVKGWTTMSAKCVHSLPNYVKPVSQEKVKYTASLIKNTVVSLATIEKPKSLDVESNIAIPLGSTVSEVNAVAPLKKAVVDVATMSQKGVASVVSYIKSVPQVNLENYTVTPLRNAMVGMKTMSQQCISSLMNSIKQSSQVNGESNTITSLKNTVVDLATMSKKGVGSATSYIKSVSQSHFENFTVTPLKNAVVSLTTTSQKASSTLLNHMKDASKMPDTSLITDLASNTLKTLFSLLGCVVKFVFEVMRKLLILPLSAFC